jgi:polar amino acid transport system substrate-binding protein
MMGFMQLRSLRASMLLLALAAASASLPALAADPETVTLYYYDRAPYYVVRADDTLTGLAIVPTRAAFERAGIPYAFERTSVQRIFELMRESPGLFCSPGWYRTDERQRFAKFTKPILRDMPTVGLARKSFEVPPGTRFADLIRTNMTLLLSNTGFSYGSYLDRLIAHKDPSQIIRLTNGGLHLKEVLLAGRADLALTTEEEAASFGAGGPDFPIIHFPDAPDGETRHIMCSRGVPDYLIERLNQAIDGPL